MDLGIRTQGFIQLKYKYGKLIYHQRTIFQLLSYRDTMADECIGDFQHKGWGGGLGVG